MCNTFAKKGITSHQIIAPLGFNFVFVFEIALTGAVVIVLLTNRDT